MIGISSKAAYLVANSSDPLAILRQISQNFPKYAPALARRVPDPPQEFLEETEATRMQLPQGFNGFWINGLMINEGDVNPLRYAFAFIVMHVGISNTSLQ